MTSISRSFYFFTQKFNISDRQLLAHCAHRYSKRGKDRGQALEKETKLFKNRFCWFIYFSGKSSFSPSDVFFGKTKIVSCQKIGPDQLFFLVPENFVCQKRFALRRMTRVFFVHAYSFFFCLRTCDGILLLWTWPVSTVPSSFCVRDGASHDSAQQGCQMIYFTCYQKSQFWYNLEGLRMEREGIFDVDLE
jgi:hypothetical protein